MQGVELRTRRARSWRRERRIRNTNDESSGDDDSHNTFLKCPKHKRKESSRRAQEGAADSPSDDDGTSKAPKPPRATKNDERDMLLNAGFEVPTVEKKTGHVQRPSKWEGN